MTYAVLVTGGSGFLAGWAIVDLLKQGYRVRTTVRSLAKADAVRAAVATQVDASALDFAVADLTSDAGWPEAVAGCDFVLHIASPLSDGADVVEAARGGTLRVLRAAVAGGVKRVVMTSSTAACTPAGPLDRAITESDWTDPDQPGLAVYRKSKVLAERAAWDFMAGKKTEFVTLLPGAIFGPVLAKDQTGSVSFIRNLLEGRPPFLPRLGFNITDVRDLAELHVRAMTEPKAAGQRFIVLGDALWYRDIAQTLRQRLDAKASKVSTRGIPDIVARVAALISPQLKSVLPLLGRTQKFSREKAERLLGYRPRPPEDTVADCAASLLT